MTSKALCYVLIDDDSLVHMTWSVYAKQREKKLFVFSSAQAFFAEMSQFGQDTPIYIDSNLGAGLRGEEIAKQIYDKGFTQLFLCTGYEPSDFVPMPWIKEIVGKEPCF